MTTLVEMGPVVAVAALCAALGLARASYYRRVGATRGATVVAAAARVEGPGVHLVARSTGGPDSEALEMAAAVLAPSAVQKEDEIARTADAPAEAALVLHAKLDAVKVSKPAKRVPRALTIQERNAVLAHLNGPRFVDLSPGETYATLLDEGTYLCSQRTMYRILAEHTEVMERRNQRRHPSYAAPELLATRPNQVWSWDITKLRGPGKGEYFHLYLILDLYSRYVVGWMVSASETAAQAEEFINETIDRHMIPRGQLTIHADRGTSMKSKSVATLLADLGVIKSHSRPSVSDDNPYSEAHFKTLKYRPDFPDRFGCIEDARAHCKRFCDWYNTEHHHSGIALLTPHDVFHGHAELRLQKRAAVLDAAYAAHPDRFVSAPPHPTPLPDAVWINKPKLLPPTMVSTSSANHESQPERVDDDNTIEGVGSIRAVLVGIATSNAIVELGSDSAFVPNHDDKAVNANSKNRLASVSEVRV
jgi:putative transposase